MNGCSTLLLTCVSHFKVEKSWENVFFENFLGTLLPKLLGVPQNGKEHFLDCQRMFTIYKKKKS